MTIINVHVNLQISVKTEIHVSLILVWILLYWTKTRLNILGFLFVFFTFYPYVVIIGW